MFYSKNPRSLIKYLKGTFKIIFKASGLLLFESKKPDRTSYYISKTYSVQCDENNDFTINLVETDLITLPSVYEILCRTKLRTDEKKFKDLSK